MLEQIDYSQIKLTRTNNEIVKRKNEDDDDNDNDNIGKVFGFIKTYIYIYNALCKQNIINS